MKDDLGKGREMNDQFKANLKSKKEGLLMPNRSAYGSIMAGRFMIPVAFLVIFILTVIPWEVIYRLSWYQGFLNVMSTLSINIKKIPETANPFPEYSMAFLGFVNTVALLYACIGIYFGLKHVIALRNILPATKVTTVKLMGLFLSFIVIILVFLWGTYIFSGESTIFPGKFYKAEWRFVSLFTLFWFGISTSCFILASFMWILFNRVINR